MMQRLGILLVIVASHVASAQDFELLESVRHSSDSAYWNNPRLLDKLNSWDIIKTNWLGFSIPIEPMPFNQHKYGISLVGPRGISLNLQDYQLVPESILTTRSGSKELFQAYEVVAQRAGVSYNPSELLIHQHSSKSINTFILTNNLNFRLFKPRLKKRERIEFQDQNYFSYNAVGSAMRSRTWGKTINFGVGLNFQNRIEYNLYSNNGLSPEYETNEGFLLGDYQELFILSPAITVLFQPKYLMIQIISIPNRRIFEVRGGISIPLRFKHGK